MKSINIIILFFLFVSTFAQPPGYLGKRFTLSYEQLTGINYFNLVHVTNLEGGYDKDPHVDESNANFNYIGTLSFDYVIGKSKSRGISISSIDQTMYFKDYDYILNGSYLQKDYFRNSAKLTGLTFGLFVKYFKKDRIAPLGDFYKFEFLYSTYKIKSYDKEAETYSLTKTIDPFSSFAFNVTMGKSRIFWDKLVISSGLSFGFRLNFITSLMDLDFGNRNYSDKSIAERTLNNAAHYWHGQNLFYNLHIGVGWLLF